MRAKASSSNVRDNRDAATAAVSPVFAASAVSVARSAGFSCCANVLPFLCMQYARYCVGALPPYLLGEGAPAPPMVAGPVPIIHQSEQERYSNRKEQERAERMSDETVEVNVEESAEAPPPDSGDTVVVVDNASESSGENTDALVALSATVGALVERVNTLEGAIAATAATAEMAEASADLAMDVADAAGQTAAEVAEETASKAEMEEIVEDVPPMGKPWFVKTRRELFSGESA